MLVEGDETADKKPVTTRIDHSALARTTMPGTSPGAASAHLAADAMVANPPDVADINAVGEGQVVPRFVPVSEKTDKPIVANIWDTMGAVGCPIGARFVAVEAPVNDQASETPTDDTTQDEQQGVTGGVEEEKGMESDIGSVVVQSIVGLAAYDMWATDEESEGVKPAYDSRSFVQAGSKIAQAPAEVEDVALKPPATPTVRFAVETEPAGTKTIVQQGHARTVFPAECAQTPTEATAGDTHTASTPRGSNTLASAVAPDSESNASSTESSADGTSSGETDSDDGPDIDRTEEELGLIQKMLDRIFRKKGKRRRSSKKKKAKRDDDGETGRASARREESFLVRIAREPEVETETVEETMDGEASATYDERKPAAVERPDVPGGALRASTPDLNRTTLMEHPPVGTE